MHRVQLVAEDGVKQYLREELQDAARQERIWIPEVAEAYLAALLADGYRRLAHAQERLQTPPQTVRATLVYLKIFADHLVYNGAFWQDPLLRRWCEKAREGYDGVYDIATRHMRLPKARVFVFAILADGLPKYIPALACLRESLFGQDRHPRR